jgi:hypothetical protein
VSVAPPNEGFAGTFEAMPVKQLGQSSGRSGSALTPQCREGSQNSLALIEVNFRDLAAVATVPPKGGAAKAIRVAEDRQMVAVKEASSRERSLSRPASPSARRARLRRLPEDWERGERKREAELMEGMFGV